MWLWATGEWRRRCSQSLCAAVPHVCKTHVVQPDLEPHVPPITQAERGAGFCQMHSPLHQDWPNPPHAPGDVRVGRGRQAEQLNDVEVQQLVHDAHAEVVDVRLREGKRRGAAHVVGKQQRKDAAVAAVQLLRDPLGKLMRPVEHIVTLHSRRIQSELAGVRARRSQQRHAPVGFACCGTRHARREPGAPNIRGPRPVPEERAAAGMGCGWLRPTYALRHECRHVRVHPTLSES